MGSTQAQRYKNALEEMYRIKNFKRRQMRDLEAVNQALNDYEKTIDKDWQPNQ